MVDLQDLQVKVLTPLGESIWFNHGCSYLKDLEEQHVIADTGLNNGLPSDETKEVYRLGIYLDDDCCNAETWIETTSEKHLLTVIKALYNTPTLSNTKEK